MEKSEILGTMTSCRLSLVFQVVAICMLVSNFAVIHKFELRVGRTVDGVSTANSKDRPMALQEGTHGRISSVARVDTVVMSHNKSAVPEIRARDDGSLGAHKLHPKKILEQSKQPIVSDPHIAKAGNTQVDIANSSSKTVISNTAPRQAEPLRPQARNGTSDASAANETSQPTILLQSSQSQFPSLSRFPKYGTNEFNKECSWLLPRLDTKLTRDNCTLLAKLYDKGNEGVSDWANKVVETHLLAVQTNCRVMIDYGVNHVDVTQIFTPATPFENWAVPLHFNCKSDPTCIQAKGMFSISSQNFTAILGKDVVKVPHYRMAYVERDHPQHWYRNDYLELRRRLPGFHLESSMACSMQSLLQLAPTAFQFEPTIFTDLLPMLQQPGVLVICLYIRSGRTDALARDEQDNTTETDKDLLRYEHQADSVMTCAQSLEQEYLASNATNYTKSVWMVITDAPYLKEYISKRQNSSTRTILSTASRGVHSRPVRKPSIQDVAEALIDWYLIGESSLVITDGSVSYGETAALRTSRPLYTSKCKRVPLVHDGRRKDEKKRKRKK